MIGYPVDKSRYSERRACSCCGLKASLYDLTYADEKTDAYLCVNCTVKAFTGWLPPVCDWCKATILNNRLYRVDGLDICIGCVRSTNRQEFRDVLTQSLIEEPILATKKHHCSDCGNISHTVICDSCLGLRIGQALSPVCCSCEEKVYNNMVHEYMYKPHCCECLSSLEPGASLGKLKEKVKL